MTAFSELHQWLLEDKTRWFIVWFTGAVMVFFFISVVSRYVETENKIPFYKTFTASLLWLPFVALFIISAVWYLLEIIYNRFTRWQEKSMVKVTVSQPNPPPKKP
ncbi:hypothetical protein CYG68_16200 [Morganella morganii]|uniref:Uncharacterized protein n=1 Tax=Morganella morganii TaxID=582 RepID=A0A8I0U840_MORMO|nr:hypothetical protein [Morganella morganii]MBE8613931.1 hypothetical protein [Morganella morganii]